MRRRQVPMANRKSQVGDPRQPAERGEIPGPRAAHGRPAPSFHYSIIPPFHCSNLPPFHRSIIPGPAHRGRRADYAKRSQFAPGHIGGKRHPQKRLWEKPVDSASAKTKPICPFNGRGVEESPCQTKPIWRGGAAGLMKDY